MSKQAIKQEFELMGMMYKLAYFPNLQDVNSLLPDFSNMRVINQGFKEFNFRGQKKYFIWKRCIIPATSMTPEKNFLMFALTDIFTQPDFIRPQEMIIYSMQPKQQQEMDLEQQFINCALGIVNAPQPTQAINTSWASDLFTVEEKEPQEQPDEATEGETVQ